MKIWHPAFQEIPHIRVTNCSLMHVSYKGVQLYTNSEVLVLPVHSNEYMVLQLSPFPGKKNALVESYSLKVKHSTITVEHMSALWYFCTAERGIGGPKTASLWDS